MLKSTLIVSPYSNPAINLAFEEMLVHKQDKYRRTLFLYQNDNTIVIGCNQNPWKECDIRAFQVAGGRIVRRQSGGGAVFHDMGNLNFSFIQAIETQNTEENYQFLIQALAKLGLTAQLNGKNDLLIEGKKFSGSAFYQEDKNFCHHGTLLISTDLQKLTRYLTPSKLKIESKAIASVRSRVVNLSDIKSDINVDKVRWALINTFRETSCGPVEYADIELSAELNSYIKTYQSYAWLYESSPQFNMSLEQRFTWGTFELTALIHNGVMETVRCYTDAIELKTFKLIEDTLPGCRFQFAELQARLKSIKGDKRIIEDICAFLKLNLS